MTKHFRLTLYSAAALIRLGSCFIAPAWYDENFTLILSRLPLRQMFYAMSGDVHPPLWYLILWPLGRLHAPIWALRLPAALFSVAALFVFERVLQELDLSPKVRAAALVLMAVLPVQLYYASEARMYALLTFLVLWAFLSVLRRQWGQFGLAGLLMLYTQYYGAFYLAALAVVGLVRNRKDFLPILRACAAAGVCFLPWVIAVMVPQMGLIHGSYWMQLTGPGMAVRVVFQSIFMTGGNAMIYLPLMLGGFAWLSAGLVHAFGNWTKGRLAVLLAASLPVFFALLASLLWQPMLHYRPLTAASPFWAILMAGPAEWLTDRRRWLYAALFALPALILSNGSIYANLNKTKTSTVTPLMEYVEQHYQPGDIVYLNSDGTWVNGSPDREDLPIYKSPDCGTVLGGLTELTRQSMGMQEAPLDQIPHTRAWVIWSDGPLDPACNADLRPEGEPVLVSIDEGYVFEGLWLVH